MSFCCRQSHYFLSESWLVDLIHDLSVANLSVIIHMVIDDDDNDTVVSACACVWHMSKNMPC